VVARIVQPSVFIIPLDDLEVVSMQMERVLSGILVVENNFDDLIFLENESICITSVYRDIIGR